jgi:hypothetical protein
MRAGSLNLASPGFFFEFQGARGGVCYLCRNPNLAKCGG